MSNDEKDAILGKTLREKKVLADHLVVSATQTVIY